MCLGQFASDGSFGAIPASLMAYTPRHDPAIRPFPAVSTDTHEFFCTRHCAGIQDRRIELSHVRRLPRDCVLVGCRVLARCSAVPSARGPFVLQFVAHGHGQEWYRGCDGVLLGDPAVRCDAAELADPRSAAACEGMLAGASRMACCTA